jgi:hypothetical protein
MKTELPSADLIRLLPPSQYKVMKQNPKAFESEVKRMNEIVAKIPGLGETDRLKRHPLSLHYFVGANDWYIAEWDKDEDLFFGYAILNHDLHNSEWGYISRAEILALEFPEKCFMINLDLHNSSETIEAALFKRDPAYFSKYAPPPATQEKQTEKVEYTWSELNDEAVSFTFNGVKLTSLAGPDEGENGKYWSPARGDDGKDYDLTWKSNKSYDIESFILLDASVSEHSEEV